MNSIHTYVILAYKESPYLEDCVKSVTHQRYKSNVVISTSTPNDYIYNIASKYNIDVMVNPNPGKGIGYDFDYAVSVANTPLTTNAHQDDIYDYDYSYRMVSMYKKNKNALIMFSDYYEIRDGIKVETNINLIIKRLLLLPAIIKKSLKHTFAKRWILKFGNAISCPAVTFVKPNINEDDIFKCDMKCDIDWYAWEKLSRQSGSFVFAPTKLMGHRVHEESTTTEIINDRIRTQEDYLMFKKFWPTWIANLLNKLYVKSEESNS